MKKKKVIALLLGVVLLTGGCSNVPVTKMGCGVNECTCDCEYCKGTSEVSEAQTSTEEAVIVRDNTDEISKESEMTSEEESDKYDSETLENEEASEETVSVEDEHKENEIAKLTEGEKKARKENQANYAKLRSELYKKSNSKSKTDNINKLDKEIIANNSYDFSKKNIVFIGDSITQGITSSTDAAGEYLSYVHYVDMYLKFNRTLNHGVGGRMYSSYGGEDLSLSMNFGNVTNNESDIIVVFAGINDYLAEVENKRFGDPKDNMSTAGYCGSLRYFMKQLKEYYSDRDIFFVTTYNMDRKNYSTYSDYKGQPSIAEHVKVMKNMAAEYGFNVIDLYGVGFMDSTDKETSKGYLKDALHPNDEGSRVLGEHIAAELSLYFSQK